MRRKMMTILALASVTGSLATAVLVLLAAPASADGSPADKYAVINATVDAATDHEIVGTSAFPNFTTGAVDNYYSMAHSHVDNSPFAEGTASPADTGPIGQTVAAGHAQQPQYADARWPGSPDKATFGSQGGPYATANAGSYSATAQASEASNGSSGTTAVAAPKGFDPRLDSALASWKSKWLDRLGLKTPPAPGGGGGGGTPSPPVTTPSVTTPVGTVPSLTTPTLPTPTVPVTASSPPSSASSSSSRSLASSSDGQGLVESSTTATLDASGNLVTGGESSLGRVSLGGGQIVIAGIDVSATITNDGTPTDKTAVDVGAASIGGVPVTIDQDGVQVKDQGANLPLQQADDALNSALKQAGIQLFTVAPEITKSPNEETITATGVHVKFTQPVDQPGVPAQSVEHILGEVFVDSLASPGTPFPNFSFNFSGPGGSSVGGGSSSSSGGSSEGSAGGSPSSVPGGGSSPGSLSTVTGGGTSAGFPSTPGTASSQPASSSAGGSTQSTPAAFLTSVVHKPMWLLVAYLVWQTLVLGTAASLRRWGIG